MEKTRIAYFLRQIPRSDAYAIAIREMVEAGEIGTCDGIARVLKLLGCVDYEASSQRIRASSQTAFYALRSLAFYVEAEQSLIGDWERRGVQTGLEGVLQNGASFLYALEHRRIAISQDVEPSRHEQVAQVLITRHGETGSLEFLMQYDENAGQYQFIGGRMKDTDADMLATLTREIAEEISPSMQLGRDYDLSLVLDKVTLPVSLSPTFGALTSYTFTIYHMQGLRLSLQVGGADRWVGIAEIERGIVGSSDEVSPLGNRDLYRIIDGSIAGGLRGLGSSLTLSTD